MTFRQDADLKIRQIETIHDFLKYQIDGWCIWPLLRFSIFYQLANLPISPKPKRSKFHRYERMIITINELYKLSHIIKARYAVLVQSSNRSEKVNKLFQDIYFDELLLDVGSYYKIENVIENHFKPRSNYALIKSDLTLTGIKLMLGMLMKSPPSRWIKDAAETFHHHIQESFELDTFSKDKITKIFQNFYWSKKLFTWLLKRINPEYLLLTTAYSYFAIIAAAKELGIEVIEFQHGLIDRYHGGYSWSSHALPYKNKMPVPDKIFLYGDYWKNELAIRGFWDREVRVVGSLRMDKYRKIKTNHVSSPCTLVLTTQDMDTELLIKFISDFLTLARGQIDVNIIIKLHPRESKKEFFEKAFNVYKNVQVVLGSERPSTFELISIADFHLSIFSTCHYEALGLGVPTVILPFTNYETALHLVETGYAYIARNPGELYEIILRHSGTEIPDKIKAFYFKPDALDNMKRELN